MGGVVKIRNKQLKTHTQISRCACLFEAKESQRDERERDLPCTSLVPKFLQRPGRSQSLVLSHGLQEPKHLHQLPLLSQIYQQGVVFQGCLQGHKPSLIWNIGNLLCLSLFSHIFLICITFREKNSLINSYFIKIQGEKSAHGFLILVNVIQAMLKVTSNRIFSLNLTFLWVQFGSPILIDDNTFQIFVCL